MSAILRIPAIAGIQRECLLWVDCGPNVLLWLGDKTVIAGLASRTLNMVLHQSNATIVSFVGFSS
jgi:hypothetical protein